MKLGFLFYTHIALMSAAFFTMIISVIFIIKKSNNWFTKHKKGMGLSLVLMFLGIISMAILKFANNFPHFSTDHSKFGILVFICAIIAAFIGNFIKNKSLKIIHKLLGGLVIFSGLFIIIEQLIEHLK